MNRIILVIFLFFLTVSSSYGKMMQDDIVDEILDKNCELKTHTQYNYESYIKLPVKLKIVNEILSEKDVYEGQEVKFRVVKDVYGKDKTYIKRGDMVTAKVKVIVTSGMNGIPASIVFGDFNVLGLNSGQLTESYEVFGQDRTLWVYPLKWALTILPPIGTVTNFIMGGHAKLKAEKQIEIFYYPEWI